ncbi:hypothetical protein TNCV_2443041 [Trichonephila clavipes]|nr:hypothetical protein TNCV_2443041 [Trichonephila clavipes]
MSARHPLVRLSLIGNHRSLRSQWCYDVAANGAFAQPMVSACNITMVGFEFKDTVNELLLWPASSLDLSPVENACTTTGPGYTTRCYTRLNLGLCGSRMDYCTPRIHSKPL